MFENQGNIYIFILFFFLAVHLNEIVFGTKKKGLVYYKEENTRNSS